MNRSQIVKNATELPVSLEKLKAHLRLTEDNEDLILRQYLAAACETTENLTNRSLCKKVRALYFDRFPVEILLPYGPVSDSPELKIEYIPADTTDGAYTTLARDKYQRDLISRRPRLLPAIDSSWPDARSVVNAVKVTYACGVSADKVSTSVKQAILFLASHWFNTREPIVVTGSGTTVMEIPKTYQYLLTANKRWVIK